MNITLIGMPGSGKSMVGQQLAGLLGWSYLDVDREIIRQTGQTLAELIDRYGDDGFRRIEEEVNAGLEVDRTVIAPGGSVIYGPKAMAHLQAIGKVVYLHVGEEELLRRLGDLHQRGVSIRPGQTFHDLLTERTPLYERYADLCQPSLADALQTARAIAEKLKLQGCSQTEDG